MTRSVSCAEVSLTGWGHIGHDADQVRVNWSPKLEHQGLPDVGLFIYLTSVLGSHEGELTTGNQGETENKRETEKDREADKSGI